jgi:hypothetical protein
MSNKQLHGQVQSGSESRAVQACLNACAYKQSCLLDSG